MIPQEWIEISTSGKRRYQSQSLTLVKILLQKNCRRDFHLSLARFAQSLAHVKICGRAQHLLRVKIWSFEKVNLGWHDF